MSVERSALYQPITVSRGAVVGMGKFKIPKTEDFKHEIQLLSFLTIEEAAGCFVSTCINLHLDGYGRSVKIAQDNMMKNAHYFLLQSFMGSFSESAWENLIELSKSDEWSNELWDAYRNAQIQLSMKGVSTDPIEELNSRLVQLEEHAKALERRVAYLEMERDYVGGIMAKIWSLDIGRTANMAVSP